MRARAWILAAVLLALASFVPAPGTAQVDPEKSQAEIAKLRAELEKISEETEQLRATNEALDARTRRWVAWTGIISSFLGSFISLSIAYFTTRTNWQMHREKLAQETVKVREEHLLKIFQSLNDEKSPSVRLGASTILIQRIRASRQTRSTTGPDELPMIASVLISASKQEDKPEIQKQIADGLAQSLGAIVPDGAQPAAAGSPLQSYDFQRVRFENAWWKRIDARGVDFYGAHLACAGLRQAFLSGTILKRANLAGSTLEDAKLDGADLRDANLTNAKMARADLQGANLARADFSGTDLRNANFVSSNFTEARFTGADITGADFGGAPPPSTT